MSCARLSQAAFEVLEQRKLLTTVNLADLPPEPITVSAGEDAFVKLVGTEAAERIEFASESDDVLEPVSRLDVFINGTKRIEIAVDSNLQFIEIDAGGGDDVLIAGQNLPVAAVFDGGDGNDLIGGSQRNDVLLGGGNDTLDGNQSGDALYGGDGDDIFYTGKLAGDEGVVFDRGNVDGEGIYLTDGNDIDLPLDDAGLFDSRIEVNLLDNTATLETANTSFFDIDYTFGGAGDDTVIPHGRVFVGKDISNENRGNQGPEPVPGWGHVALSYSATGLAGQPGVAGGIEVFVSAFATEPADSTRVGQELKDFGDSLVDLADLAEFNLASQFVAQPNGRQMITLSHNFTEALTTDEVDSAIFEATRESVRFAAETRRLNVARTFDYQGFTVTYDPVAGTIVASGSL